MPRPRKSRLIEHKPGVTYFKPRGKRLAGMEEVILGFDEVEAVRWCDYEGIDQVNAAKKMAISQSTLQRLLSTARSKIAEALIGGKAIRLEGGDYRMVNRGRGRGPGRGGRGRMGGPQAAGPGGQCVCPNCGHSEPHVAGQPCMNKDCPECGTKMARE